MQLSYYLHIGQLNIINVFPLPPPTPGYILLSCPPIRSVFILAYKIVRISCPALPLGAAAFELLSGDSGMLWHALWGAFFGCLPEFRHSVQHGWEVFLRLEKREKGAMDWEQHLVSGTSNTGKPFQKSA